MANLPPLDDEDRENLVAYLDGELDESAAAAVEARLSLDNSSRSEAELLKKTWDLLDYLPRPEPSPAFTHRTMERISALRTAPLTSRVHRLPTWALGVGWVAALLLVTAGGFAGGRFLPHPAPATPEGARIEGEQEMIRDLRVIKNRRLYQHVDSIDFIKMLADPNDPDFFGEENQGS
jgi:hypothetical protein